MSKFNFYIKQDGNVYGPYSIDEVRSLGLLDDTEVMETSVGEWYPANYYNFDELYMKEHGYYVSSDGLIHRGTTTPNTTNNIGSDHEISTECPESAKGWSWGAFFFTWIWGVFNDVFWPLIVIPISFIPYVGGIANLIICIILGINGKEMAWKNGKWKTIDSEEFIEKQKGWSNAAISIIIILIFITILIIANAANN